MAESSIDKYDISTNPDEHINAYVTQVSLYVVDDTLLCQVFPISLKGTVLNWFTRLPPLSIDCYDFLI